MPRLQFQPAARYAFATEMPIEPGQINEGGHLDNVQLLALVSVARTRFFTWLGYSVLDVAGHAFFVADQAKNVLTAPVAALQGSAAANRQTAQVIAANGEIQSREVRTGISDRLKVQIIEGLNEGDHLLIGPADGSGG